MDATDEVRRASGERPVVAALQSIITFVMPITFFLFIIATNAIS
jgi:hypothetical protein